MVKTDNHFNLNPQSGIYVSTIKYATEAILVHG